VPRAGCHYGMRQRKDFSTELARRARSARSRGVWSSVRCCAAGGRLGQSLARCTGTAPVALRRPRSASAENSCAAARGHLRSTESGSWPSVCSRQFSCHASPSLSPPNETLARRRWPRAGTGGHRMPRRQPNVPLPPPLAFRSASPTQRNETAVRRRSVTRVLSAQTRPSPMQRNETAVRRRRPLCKATAIAERRNALPAPAPAVLHPMRRGLRYSETRRL